MAQISVHSLNRSSEKKTKKEQLKQQRTVQANVCFMFYASLWTKYQRDLHIFIDL